MCYAYFFLLCLLVSFRLEAGALTRRDDFGANPLKLYGVELRNPSTVSALLRNHHYYSPNRDALLELNLAACGGHAVRVRELLATDLPVNYTIVGCSPLHCAIEHPDIVQELLKHRADPNQRDRYNKTPLHYAARWGKITVVKALLGAGADPNRLGKDQHSIKAYSLTPLHEAAAHNQHEVLQEMLNVCTSVKWAVSGPTLLHSAVESGNVRIVNTVLSAVREPFMDLPDPFGRTVLRFAVRYGYLDIVQALLVQGADVTDTQDDWKTSLPHLACEQKDGMLLILLLRAGACPDLQDEKGETALHCAASDGQLALVRALVQYGASAAICNTKGRSPLHRIAVSDRANRDEDSLVSQASAVSNYTCSDEPDAEQDQLDADIAELLIQAGANINQIDEGGRTPLLYAARAGKVALVKLLLCQGADVHIYTGRGNGPLHNAANKQVVELLLQAGANIEELNVCGRTPVMNSVCGIVEELFGRGASFPTKELDTRISVDQEIENVLKQSKPIAHQWAWELQQLLLSENVTQMLRLAPDLVTLICTFATNVKPKRVPNLSDR